MSSVFIGLWHGFHSLGRDINALHQALRQGKSVMDHPESVIGRALKNDICGRMPWEWLEQAEFTNKVVKNGPIEARWAWLAVHEMLNQAGLFDAISGSETGLYCGTMNNNYGMVGLRNGYRVCADANLRYDKKTFDSMIAKGFGYVHPMVPVYKIPNNAIANIALDLNLGGNNANYFGEDSSAVAIQACAEKIQMGRIQTGLVFSANHIFLNYMDFLLDEVQDMVKKNPQRNPEKHSLMVPTEGASALLMGSEEGLGSYGVQGAFELLSWVQQSDIGDVYTRKTSADHIRRVIQRSLKMAGLEFSDLDFVMLDGLDQELVHQQVLKDFNSGDKVHLVTPTSLTGYELCATTGLNLVLTLQSLHKGELIDSYGQIEERGSFYSQGTESGDFRLAGVLSQSLNGTIQFLIVKKR